jgi:cellulose synthase/poly-beta-1,6-N-acetylglucosamine synthase-like glycosyltransferase
MMEWIIIGTYSFALGYVCFFSLGQLNLTWHYIRKKPTHAQSGQQLPDVLPRITIQLPVYNEKYVVERLIDSVCNLDYPKELLEIQVLDDSTDETIGMIESKVKHYVDLGFDITHIRRAGRAGFKAGALAYGLTRASGEFIAIFDADFKPRPDFLMKTLPHFTSESVGMVQTRWGHINESYSILTRMQAFGLNAHFTVEQLGRKLSGSLISFNGTGGIWRKDCIEDAGGWHHDTLTEDLDLSYRAQLKGWEFKYLEEVESPAELPVVLPAIKSQQYRWNKGAAETARKHLPTVLKSDLKGIHKLRAVMHLLNSSVFFFLLVAGILSIPMLYLKETNPGIRWVFDMGSIFIVGFIAIGIFYWVASKSVRPERTLGYYLGHFPLFLSFSMGMALHNSLAVLEGLVGIKSPFLRTPKFNVVDKEDQWKGNQYIHWKITPLSLLEGLLALYFLFGIGVGIYLEDYGLVLFHVMLSFGFGTTFIYSVLPRYAV